MHVRRIFQIKTIDVYGRINRMTVTHNVDIVVLNGTNLISYRDGKRYRQMKLPVVGKSLSAFEDEVVSIPLSFTLLNQKTPKKYFNI